MRETEQYWWIDTENSNVIHLLIGRKEEGEVVAQEWERYDVYCDKVRVYKTHDKGECTLEEVLQDQRQMTPKFGTIVEGSVSEQIPEERRLT